MDTCAACGYSAQQLAPRGPRALVIIRSSTGSDHEELWCGSCVHALSDWKRERKINEQRVGHK